MSRAEYPTVNDGDGTDVLDADRAGYCPRCGAILQPPEYTYDETGVQLIEGSPSVWCGACGWDAEEA